MATENNNLGKTRDMFQEHNDAVQELGLTINFEKIKMMSNMILWKLIITR